MMKYKLSRIAVRVITAAIMCLGTQIATAQTWPSKPIQMIVPYAVGQGTDSLARFLSDAVGKELGQSIIVENRPGAGGNVGSQIAARASGDGYTFLIGTNATHAANSYLYSKPGFNPQADFEPVAMVALVPMVYVTKFGNSINTIPELIKAARAKPDALNIAISATTYRVAQELFKSKADAPLFIVDFKGSSQGLTAVMGGQVEFMVDSIAALRGAIMNKQVTPLGVTSATGNDLLPGVKSLAEQGVAGYELTGWIMMFAPKGTSTAIIQRMSNAVQKVVANPDAKEKFLQLGMVPQQMPKEQMRKFIETEHAKWGQLFRMANVKPLS